MNGYSLRMMRCETCNANILHERMIQIKDSFAYEYKHCLRCKEITCISSKPFAGATTPPNVGKRRVA
ncbi:MAG: hypothetical protein NVSMB66_6190 [Candidatus Doudnabacteria bacterium]